MGPEHINHLLGYNKETGNVDIIEIPSLTVKPFHPFPAGIPFPSFSPLFLFRFIVFYYLICFMCRSQEHTSNAIVWKG